jgi:hypothetical protein
MWDLSVPLLFKDKIDSITSVYVVSVMQPRCPRSLYSLANGLWRCETDFLEAVTDAKLVRVCT